MSNSKLTGKGPRPGWFVLGVDLAQIHDQSAFVVMSVSECEIVPGRLPIRTFVVDHVEALQGSKTKPLELDALARRAIEISKSFPPPGVDGGCCPIVFDQHLAIEFSAKLRAVGYSELITEGQATTRDFRRMTGATYHQSAMAAASQTARWRLVREVVHGGRLKIPATAEGRSLSNQLAQLRAWELAGGLLRVEAARDDIADALALAVEVASALPATDIGDLEIEYVPINWSAETRTLSGGGARYWKRLANGARMPAEMPRSDPNFEAYAVEMIASGARTPRIIEWEQEQKETKPVGLSIRVVGG